MTNPELRRAAELARTAVQAGLDVLTPRLVSEQADQYDMASPCEEPPDEGPDGRTQWVVSRRAFLREGTDPEAVLAAARPAYPATEGWRVVLDKSQPDEHRVQLAQGELVITLAVGRSAPAPQIVISSATDCLRNGG